MKKIILLIYLLSSLNTFSQEYQITSVPVIQYSIDRFTNEIYYQHEFTEEVFKTNSIGSYNILTEFTSVPQFANISHKAAYIDFHQSTSDLYLHDFEKDTSYFIISASFFSSNLLFSPSDDNILVTGESNIELLYYSFSDSSIHQPGVTIYTIAMEWLSDTTIIYNSIGEIIMLNITDLSSDTLVVVPDTVILHGLAYNTNLNAFAYSKEYYYTVSNSLINMYYLINGVDTTVYNFQEQGPSPLGFGIIIRSLTWEKNTNKLGFVGEVPLVPLSMIYIYNYNTSNTNLYTDPLTTGDGIKYNLRWLNEDTVIYSDYSDGRLLFGLDVTNPVSVFENLHEVIDWFDIKVYPNPFNNFTKFIVSIPSSGDLTVELFNCLGETIVRKNFNYVLEINFTFDWNDIQTTKNLPAGVYFLRANFINSKSSIYKTIKLVYLK